MSIYTDSSKLQKQVRQGSGNLAQDFAVVERILRNRQQFFEEIRDNVDIFPKIVAMIVSIVAFFAIYGAVLGATHSLWQALSAATKLPMVFLATSIVCLPTLYIFSLLFGSRERLHQTVSLILSSVTVTGVLLLSFAPITFLFMLTTSDYQFFKLLNVFFFTVAGGIGLYFLNQGRRVLAQSNEEAGARYRSFVFHMWTFLYIFVGCQLSWTLRPFVGHPEAPFELVRQLGGNFYSNILYSIGELLGLWVVM